MEFNVGCLFVDFLDLAGVPIAKHPGLSAQPPDYVASCKEGASEPNHKLSISTPTSDDTAAPPPGAPG